MESAYTMVAFLMYDDQSFQCVNEFKTMGKPLVLLYVPAMLCSSDHGIEQAIHRELGWSITLSSAMRRCFVNSLPRPPPQLNRKHGSQVGSRSII